MFKNNQELVNLDYIIEPLEGVSSDFINHDFGSQYITLLSDPQNIAIVDF